MKRVSVFVILFFITFFSAVTSEVFLAYGQDSVQTQNATSRVLTLQDCISLATTDNVNVKNAALDYKSAQMLKKEAYTHYFPSVGVYAGGFHSLDPFIRIGVSDVLGSSGLANSLSYLLETTAPMLGLNTSYQTLNNAFAAVVNVTQPVFAGGRIVNSNKLASLGIEAASLNESIAKRDIVSEVEKKYWLAVSLEEKMKVVDKGLALADSLYKDALSAISSGILTESVAHEIDITRQDLKAKKIRLKGGIILSRMDLCSAIGLSYSEARSFVLSYNIEKCLPPESYYQDPVAAVRLTEESKLLDLSVQQKELEKKLAMGDALPQLAVGAMYGYGKIIGPSSQQNGMVYATLKIPLTDWSTTGYKMKNIEYQLQKANNQREYLNSMLELQLRQLWVEVESTWEELQLSDEKIAHAKEMCDIAAGNFIAGFEPFSTLMEKQVDLSNAECESVDAKIAYLNAVAAFVSKSGERQ